MINEHILRKNKISMVSVIVQVTDDTMYICLNNPEFFRKYTIKSIRESPLGSGGN
jgi:hypothetical protein